MTWWREGNDVAMHLIFITKKCDLKEKFKKGESLTSDKDLWDVWGFNFKLTWKEVKEHNDEMSEQLWAMSQGL